jgi:hypothetical protein
MPFGAGATLRLGERVSGLATAVRIWVTAAVGVLIGAGFWVIGIASTLILLVIVNITGFASSRIGILGGAITHLHESPRRDRYAYRGPETAHRTSRTLGTRCVVALALELDAGGFGDEGCDGVPEHRDMCRMVAVDGVVVSVVQ